MDIRKVWNLALKGAGLLGRPGLTPHSIRHSFATHFLEGGGSVTDLMTQLGHSKLETTQIYAAGVSERRRATVSVAGTDLTFDFFRDSPPRCVSALLRSADTCGPAAVDVALAAAGRRGLRRTCTLDGIR